ncbi:MAG TPA: LPS export ABC transporter periplasmic protein LptC [Spirochaetota bacterium]|nr:LPS export ABC transporter periplasmic protein LptC [Spirochaetota bacterium]
MITVRAGGRRTVRWFFQVCLFVLVFVPVVAVCSAGKEDGAEAPDEDAEKVPDYVFHDVVHHHYEDGVRKIKVIFETGRYFSDELLVENCRFVYYDRKGEVVSKGSSRRAKLNAEGTELIAEEDVVVISEENKGRLDTEYLEWHSSDNQFTTDRFVKITQENGDTISGVGMVADIGLKRVTIKRDVRGSIREKEQR